MKGQQKKIMLVEDHMLLAVLETKILQKAGYEVLHFLNGEDAVEQINRGTSFDLIIMDIDLGEGINGVTAARKISKLSEIPVLFFTSYSEDEVEQLAGNFNSYTCLSKLSPVHMLHTKIEKILSVTSVLL